MTLRQRGRRLMAQVDALSLRERALLMLGGFMILFLLWDWLLMADIGARRQAVNAQIETARDGIASLNRAIEAAARRHGDPNAELEQRLEAAQERIRALDTEIAARASQVIPPREMAGVLEEILRRQGRLTLVRMESLPPDALFELQGDAEGTPVAASVYRHGLELEVEGRYLDVLDYLRQLEGLKWQFFWEALELESEDYPKNRVRIRIYSLNLEEGWLGV